MKRNIKPIAIFVEIIFGLGLILVNHQINKLETTPIEAQEKIVYEDKSRVSSGTIEEFPPVAVEMYEASPPETAALTTPSKDNYLVAFIGDSMIETMGGGLPYVYKELKEKYPETDFVLYNYGIGSENVLEATSRLSIPYSYKDRNFPPLSELGADIIVVGSYAYNPIVPFSKNEQWLLLADFINKIKNYSADVYLLAEIAPVENGFGEGPGGVNWPSEVVRPHVESIFAGLENAIGLAETLEVGLINVFQQSKVNDSKYGEPKYVTSHDGLHYSEEGQEFTAKTIADTLVFK